MRRMSLGYFCGSKKKTIFICFQLPWKIRDVFLCSLQCCCYNFFFFLEVWFQHSKVSSERSNKRACVTHRTRNSIRVSKFYRRLQKLRVDRPCEAELRRVLQFRILVEICLRNFDSSVDNSREPYRYFLLQPLIHTF